MPDLIVSNRRQRPLRRFIAPPRSVSWSFVLLAALATHLFACDAPGSEPTQIPNAPTASEEDSNAAPEDESATAVVDDEPKADQPPTPVEQTDDGSPVEGAIFDGRLAELESATEARDLAHIHISNTHVLLVGSKTVRRTTTVTTWLLPRGQHDTAIPANDRLDIVHGSDPAIGPRVIPRSDGGALLIKATDSLGEEGAPGSFVTRRIGPDGNIEEISTPMVIPGWTMRRAWTATRLGDEVLVCFLGAPGTPATAGPIDVLACGTMTNDGEFWSQEPTQVAAATDSSVSLEAPFTSGGNESFALLTYFDPSPGVRRVMGIVITHQEAALRLSPSTDLTGDSLADGAEFEFRRDPMALSVHDGAVYALPAHGNVGARAGHITPEGAIRGTPNTVTSVGSIFEAPRFIVGDQGTGLLFDATGRGGERSLLGYGPEGAFLMDIVGMFGGEADLRSQARLGPTTGRTATFVWNVEEGAPRVAVVEHQRF